MHSDISLLNKGNNKGSRFEPCGSPDSASEYSEIYPLKITVCLRLRKYEVNNFNIPVEKKQKQNKFA